MTGVFTINNRRVNLAFEGSATLLDLLRDNGWNDVKRGCAHGECGSCIVLVDGVPQNACQVYAATVLGASITTSRGLTADGSPHPLHTAFAESGAVQCGYCTPGTIVSAYALLSHNPSPTTQEIKDALAGNICRCTGYVKTVQAVERAAAHMSTRPDARRGTYHGNAETERSGRDG